MIEALRGLGYTTPTAIADIIDNSISAAAQSIRVDFTWSGDASHVSILDDGKGMTASELDAAMRLGERNPLDQRNMTDLGRFGLGLKTASFSQCRRLTVATIQDGHMNCLRWDLDVIAASSDDGWHLLEGPAAGSEALLAPLMDAPHGTLVLWERLDRVISPAFAEQNFHDLIDDVERHLEMVFHRYLEGQHPDTHLFINGKIVRPWDPFLRSHPATWTSPVERLRSTSGIVEIQCHVLPHKDHLTPELERSVAGPHGWSAQQGFYVYRNKRLLLAASWLGLGHGRSWTKDEAHRLARIRLDIPNSSDTDWKIDIRKSTASPPVQLRSSLTRLAEETRTRARRVFATRGQPASTRAGQVIANVWQPDHTSSGIRYRIQLDHPAVRSVLEDAGDLSADIRAMLRVIEETVPVQRIWLDTTESRETPRMNFAGEPTSEVRSVLLVMYRNLVIRKRMSPTLARDRLMNTEPFNNYSEIVASLPDDPDVGGSSDSRN